MKILRGKKITIIEAEENNFLIEKGKDSSGLLIEAIYINGQDIPDFEERKIRE